MGVCVTKLPHNTDECNTKSGLQVFYDKETDTYDGYCFACSTPVGRIDMDSLDIVSAKVKEPPTPEEISETLAEISGYPVVDIPTRKLRAVTLEKFGVKVSLSEYDGKTPTAMYFPMTKEGKVTGYYVKSLPKEGKSRTWAVGDVKGADPFGWREAERSGGFKLIITEGLPDALAVDRIHDLHGNDDYRPAVISLPNGVASVKSLARIAGKTKQFKDIILCFDNDEPGQEAVKKAMLIFPHALSVVLPDKDANDCLMNGRAKAAFNILAFKATAPKNTRLVSGFSIHDSAREPTPYGQLTWPFPTMNKLMRNLRTKETIYIGSGVKMGKTELRNQIAAHLIKEHDAPVFMASPEEDIKKTYKLLAGKVVGSVFHDPEREFDYEMYDKAGEILKDKLMLLDVYQHLGWETLKADIINAANNGAKAVFIDPITNLTNGVNAADANTKLQEVAQDVSAMALDLDIVVFMFCHLKAHDGTISREVRQKKYNDHQYVGLGNCSHERGGDILSNQFTGSRAMMRSCNFMLGLEGNKDPELPEHIRNQRWLSILEDREFGNAARIGLTWNPDTTLYSEI